MNAELLKTVLFNNADLKAYFRFESGALTTDSSGNSHTLTAISDPADTTGVFGGAVDLDSGDAYSHADHADFKPTGAFSVGCWAKYTLTDTMIFQSYYFPSRVAGFTLYATAAGKFRFQSGRDTGTSKGTHYEYVDGATTVNDGAWHHLVAVWDTAFLRVYVDEKHDGSITWANAPAYDATLNKVRVGCRNESGTDALFLTGQIDELFLLNGTALSADQIKELYEGRFLGEAWPNIAQQTYSKELATTSLAINTNLKAYYKFESGALTTDSSGNSHTLTNNGTIVNATGKYGDGADLELSSTQYFSHADHADFNPSGDFSIGGWIKLESVGGGVDRAIVHKGDGTSGAGSCLDFFVKDDATLTGAYFVGSSDARATTTTTLATGTWYHVIFQRSGNNCYIYINGKLSAVSASLSGANNNEANEFRIGSFCNNTRHFDGVIDDFFFLNGSALSADQIDELYSIRGGLVAGYHLSNETDFSGNNYNLTNNNTATFGAGKFGNKATFNGSNQSLSINNSFGIDGGEISISAWINPTTVTSASDHLSYVSLFGNTTKTGYGLFVGTTGIGATRLRAGVAWDDGAQVAISAGVWVHAVLTYDGTNLKLYINGSLRDSRVASGSGSASATSKATLGCRADVDALTGQLATSLDEVLFFNRVLSSREIRRMYALGVGKYD